MLFGAYTRPTVDDGSEHEDFDYIQLKTGETLTRAFLCDADADVLHQTLYLDIGVKEQTIRNTAYSDFSIEMSYWMDLDDPDNTEELNGGTVTYHIPDLPEVAHK
jgi:hypothetical protein